MAKSGVADALLRAAESHLPPEFCQYNRKPKFNSKVAIVCATLILLTSIAAFVKLVLIGSKKILTESEISAFDITGQKGNYG